MSERIREEQEFAVENRENGKELTFSAKTEGKKVPDRQNEDTILSLPNLGFFAVFDGLGGYYGGAIASRLSAKFMEQNIQQEELAILQDSIDHEALLEKLLYGANLEILAEQEEPDMDSKMGATAAVSLFWKDQDNKQMISIGHVGDSRIYRFRSGKLEHLTLDDGIFKGSKRDGLKLQEELANVDSKDAEILKIKINAYIFQNRHKVAQCLGNVNMKPHLVSYPTEPGDVYLLVTDGITDNLTSQKITEIINSSKNETEIVDHLIQNSITESENHNSLRGKKDDMSAIVVKIKP